LNGQRGEKGKEEVGKSFLSPFFFSPSFSFLYVGGGGGGGGGCGVTVGGETNAQTNQHNNNSKL